MKFSRALPLLLLLLLVPFVLAAETQDTAAPDPASAFESLKALAGSWQGTSGPADGERSEVEHELRVASAGTVVMETMMPGTDHEMINMYHMDGEDLVLTHYCAGGNQPHMKYDPSRSSAGKLVFDFAGGTNLDPEKDGHIHSTTLVLEEDGIEEHWNSYYGGKPAGTSVFRLTRKDG